MKHFYAGYFTAFAIFFGIALIDRQPVTDSYSYSANDYNGGYDYGSNDDYGDYSSPYDIYDYEDDLIWT